jgi:hypothetical protein
MRVLVLGAGFGGLELTTRLSDQFGDDIDVVLIDRSDGFVFGFSKLDVMFGKGGEPVAQSADVVGGDVGDEVRVTLRVQRNRAHWTDRDRHQVGDVLPGEGDVEVGHGGSCRAGSPDGDEPGSGAPVLPPRQFAWRLPALPVSVPVVESGRLAAETYRG